MKKKLLSLLMIANAMVAAEVKPIKMDVSQECYLSNTGPFDQANENSLFKITVKDEVLLGNQATIKEISLWSDGEIFPIKAGEERMYKDNTIKLVRKSNELFANELKSILNAKFVKLFVKYQDNVNVEKVSIGRSSYFTTVKTTVAKDQYFPVILPQAEIHAALAECTQTLEDQKNRQSLFETVIVIGTLLAIAGIIAIILRYRRSRKE